MTKCSCLILEDDWAIRDTLQILFNSLIEKDPHLAKNNEEAIDIIDKFRPNLLFLDFLLYGATDSNLTLEYIKLLEGYFPKIYIISAMEKKAIELLKYPYILKPFDIKYIEQIIIDNIGTY